MSASRTACLTLGKAPHPDEYAAEMTPERVWMLLRTGESLAGIGNRRETVVQP
jgi:hypothetical protein